MEFKRFFEGEAEGLRRMCALVLLDAEEAHDVTQEVMVRAWGRWEKIREENPGAWCRVVALNLCRSRWRRVSRDQRLQGRLAAEREPAVLAPIETSMLHSVLVSLSPRQREVVVLHYWIDRTVAESARLMGIHTGSAKRHLARAHARLALAYPELDEKEKNDDNTIAR